MFFSYFEMLFAVQWWFSVWNIVKRFFLSQKYVNKNVIAEKNVIAKKYFSQTKN